MGRYPVEAAGMLARIAAATEIHRPSYQAGKAMQEFTEDADVRLRDLIAFSVEKTLEHVSPAVVMVPTQSGATARSISRFRLPKWIAAVSSQAITCQQLQFSYGVHSVHEPNYPENWNTYARDWLHSHGVEVGLVVLTEGPYM